MTALPKSSTQSVSCGRWELPVLTYHLVGERRRGVEPTLTVTPRQFEEQLEWLQQNGYSTITATQLDAILGKRDQMPERAVMITFDDAYAELCDVALPALRSRGFTATVFVVTNLIGTTNSWDEKIGWRTLPLMTRDQIRFWDAQGIEFGAHSNTHPDLQSLSEHELHEEFAKSRKTLGAILNRDVISCAYPYGSHNDRVRDIAEQYFKVVFTMVEGLNGPDVRRGNIKRTMVRPADGLHAFKHRVQLGTSPFYDVRNWRARFRIGTRLRKLFRSPKKSA